MAFFPSSIAAAAVLFILSLSTTLSAASAHQPAPLPTHQTLISSNPKPRIPSTTLSSPPSPMINDNVPLPIEEEETDTHVVEIQLYVAMDKMKSFLEKRLKRTAAMQGNTACMRACELEFQKAENSLYDVIDNLNHRNYKWAGVELSSFASSIRACRECFGDTADAEIRKFQGWTRGVAGEWLEKINKYSTCQN